jgi:hypothetical protein
VTAGDRLSLAGLELEPVRFFRIYACAICVSSLRLRGETMSQLFVRDAEHGWSVRPLKAAGVELSGLLSSSASPHSGIIAGETRARMVGFRSGAQERWAVLVEASARLRVNGAPIGATGIRVLEHKDEISLQGLGCVFYSAEGLAEVVPFPEFERAVYCGRCRQALTPGNPAVQCPDCGVWHDQSEALGCWLYSASCACCPARTALDAGLVWTPED